LNPKPFSPITIIGEDVPCGTYLLRIAVARPLAVVFGRFHGRLPVSVPVGRYVYVGSAMAEKGAASLARRVMRHATRTGENPPHRLRPELAAAFAAAGMGEGNLIPKKKTLRWHIDFLLDDPAVEIDRVLILRATRRRESAVAKWLAAQAGVSALARGLGASDARRETHVFRVPDDAGWWEMVVGELKKVWAAREPPLRTKH